MKKVEKSKDTTELLKTKTKAAKPEIIKALRVEKDDINWSEVYSEIRNRSDWIQEINSKYGGTIAYWDSRATEFTHGANYYDQISSEIVGFVGTASTLLEIGAGTGNFTLPLSPHQKKILAVEPAPKMINRLKERLDTQKIKNVELQHNSWEDAVITEKFDVVLFSHSIYFVKDIASAVEKAKSYVNKTIVILSRVFDSSDVFSKVSEVMTGRKSATMPDYTVICMACRQLGLTPEVKIVSTDTTYSDYRQLYSKLTNNFHEDTLKKKEMELHKLIRSHYQISALSDGEWFVKDRFRTAIITCKM